MFVMDTHGPDLTNQFCMTHIVKETFYVKFYAVASIRSGDDIKTVQENLGHATAAFTLDIYGHVTEQMKQASADRMEQFIQAVNS